ncbi:hypothetical protein AAFF_G00116320 [Aldrovandia affinis]|uniref:Uncharacterized protein n=1 Tax=Aldrovandia affinis TaxID=143900 RepID=A0AAD7T1L4_9TELE|nr:hypothetical protein AAFF_G00116320 [Aldrovandia affinis]
MKQVVLASRSISARCGQHRGSTGRLLSGLEGEVCDETPITHALTPAALPIPLPSVGQVDPGLLRTWGGLLGHEARQCVSVCCQSKTPKTFRPDLGSPSAHSSHLHWVFLNDEKNKDISLRLRRHQNSSLSPAPGLHNGIEQSCPA